MDGSQCKRSLLSTGQTEDPWTDDLAPQQCGPSRPTSMDVLPPLRAQPTIHPGTPTPTLPLSSGLLLWKLWLENLKLKAFHSVGLPLLLWTLLSESQVVSGMLLHVPARFSACPINTMTLTHTNMLSCPLALWVQCPGALFCPAALSSSLQPVWDPLLHLHVSGRSWFFVAEGWGHHGQSAGPLSAPYSTGSLLL